MRLQQNLGQAPNKPSPGFDDDDYGDNYDDDDDAVTDDDDAVTGDADDDFTINEKIYHFQNIFVIRCFGRITSGKVSLA